MGSSPRLHCSTKLDSVPAALDVSAVARDPQDQILLLTPAHGHVLSFPECTSESLPTVSSPFTANRAPSPAPGGRPPHPTYMEPALLLLLHPHATHVTGAGPFCSLGFSLWPGILSILQMRLRESP